MTIGRRLKARVAVGSAVAALALAATPLVSASASAESSIQGYGSGTQFTEQPSSPGDPLVSLTTCSNQFSGRVTADNGSGQIEANIDHFSFGCSASVSVVPTALPWTLKLNKDSNYTIEGFNVNITTPQGTCRYSGPVRGDMEFPGNIYTLTGLLTRQSAGCGGTERLSISDLTEVVGAGF